MTSTNAALLKLYGVDNDPEWKWRGDTYATQDLQRILTDSGLKPVTSKVFLIVAVAAAAWYFFLRKKK